MIYFGLRLAILMFQILLWYFVAQRDGKALLKSVVIAVLLCCEGVRYEL
jgi:hypothetical protein